MDILKSLRNETIYSQTQLQLILSAWVLSTPFERRKKIQVTDGDVAEEDYDKRSIYSLLYALYRSMGEVRSETGARYQATFNTWGYTWPKSWAVPEQGQRSAALRQERVHGSSPIGDREETHRREERRVHIVEMGCGPAPARITSARASLPTARTKPSTCRRPAFRPAKSDSSPSSRPSQGDARRRDRASDRRSQRRLHRRQRDPRHRGDRPVHGRRSPLLQDGVPRSQAGWLPRLGKCDPGSDVEAVLRVLDSIGMKLIEVNDVTEEAVRARDEDKARIDAYAEQCGRKFRRLPHPGHWHEEAPRGGFGLENFCRNPGTRLYEDMRTRRDTYKVIVAQKKAD